MNNGKNSRMGSLMERRATGDLKLLPGSRWWYDREIKGHKIEIKSCSFWDNGSMQRGQFFINQKNHNKLLKAGGFYLFVVRYGYNPLVYYFLPARAVSKYMNGSETVKLTWTTLLNGKNKRG